ncbi:Uncharacterized protein dnm_080740 [Desulfonema magnum]|uniref:Uncharacterized protein n=1 Tax=Desulfonema magnum TaxID=45655 RepID=A0A975BUH9_9BACT|nr:Uncharacterized protein dnm_080740 [Desulfonema magnum]
MSVYMKKVLGVKCQVLGKITNFQWIEKFPGQKECKNEANAEFLQKFRLRFIFALLTVVLKQYVTNSFRSTDFSSFVVTGRSCPFI